MDSGEFVDHVTNITSYGYTCTLLALGHELGLFDLMIKENRPMTSHELSEKAGMKERYVREWLNGAATGKLVTYDPGTQSFYIPEAWHVSLRGQSAWACGVLAIGAQKETVKELFRKDGPHGLPFNTEDGYWSWFGDWRNLTGRSYIQDDVVPRLRESGVAAKLESGMTVLDACCGSGILTFSLAECFPNAKFTGVDISDKALSIATETSKSSNISNVQFSKADVQRVSTETTHKYDVITLLDAIHELPKPNEALIELEKVLNPGGIFICTENTPSVLQDDVGNLRVASTYAITLNHCVPSKVYINPDAESEASWLMSDFIQAIGSVFQITHTFRLKNNAVMMICKKRENGLRNQVGFDDKLLACYEKKVSSAKYIVC